MVDAESSSASGFAPLQGVRIVDFSANIAGPYATMILAQLGADVVHVESPQGDDSRQWAGVGDISVVHRLMGAGKRGMVIDLKNPQGLSVARTLIKRADVVLQSMRPGVAERIGIGESAVRALNAGALYYDLNAFGTGSVGSALPGYDPLVQAFTGIMEMTGYAGSPPTRCAPSIIDLGTGQRIAMGILASLIAKGRGQPVKRMETALVDTGFSVVGYQATAARMTGKRPARSGSGNPIAAPYQCYLARDGHLMIAAANEKLWRKLVKVFEAPHLLEDARFGTVEKRSRNNAELEQELTALLATDDVDTWLERFTSAGVPATRVYGLEAAIQSEVAQERQTILESDGVPLVRLPWLVDGNLVPWRRPAPALGEHTAEVLAEIGYSAANVRDLVACGAVATARQASA